MQSCNRQVALSWDYTQNPSKPRSMSVMGMFHQLRRFPNGDRASLGTLTCGVLPCAEHEISALI